MDYTFEFATIGPNSKTSRRRVSAADLLEKFDQALAWRNEKPSRLCYVFGPGVMRTIVCQDARRHVERVHAERTQSEQRQADQRKQWVGLAWGDLTNSVDGIEMVLYKCYRKVEELGFEQPVAGYGLATIAPSDYDKAFRWAKEFGWRGIGFWYRDKPMLVFCGDPGEVQRAFSEMPNTGKHLETGQLERAPVRYARRQTEPPYTFIQTTRSRRAIQQLRARYPNVGEDLKFVPSEILIRRHGYGHQVGALRRGSTCA